MFTFDFVLLFSDFAFVYACWVLHACFYVDLFGFDFVMIWFGFGLLCVSPGCLGLFNYCMLVIVLFAICFVGLFSCVGLLF